MYKGIYLDAPNVGPLEKKWLNRIVESGYISTYGPFVSKFEKRFKDYLGVKDAVSTQSGTAALHLALRVLGIGKGDEVIIPALTFIATANPVAYTGATPVFADIDIATWNLDPAKLKKKISKRTRAIIPVHLYGNPCAMESILSIARIYGLYVIEDATESLGAAYKGRPTGTFGDFGCFSFNGNKIMTTAGGGMLISKNRDMLKHARRLANQARDPDDENYHLEIGFNYRLNNLQAALGLAQIERLDGFLRKKREFNAIYKEELKGFEFIRFQEACEGAQSSYWFTCIRFENGIDVAIVQKKLAIAGIGSRRVFMPLVEFPPYKTKRQSRLIRAEYKNSYEIYNTGLCLPSSTLNTKDKICKACDALKKALKNYKIYA